MIQDKTPVHHESPAQRLGTLYVASFVMIVVLSGFGQFFILRELSGQSNMASSVIQLVEEGSTERSLSLLALTLLSEQDTTRRAILLESFRKSLGHRRNETTTGPTSSGKRAVVEGANPDSIRLLSDAEAHRVQAREAANRLLVILEKDSTVRSSSPEVEPLLRQILSEEEAATRTIAEVVRDAGTGSVVQFSRLEQFEFKLFGLVLIVLVLEGLFVVDPAVRKIKVFMRDMSRSNEELKLYAQKLERSNRELQDFASVASHDLQEPLRKVQAFSDRLKSRSGPALDAQGRDYLDRVQNAAARMQTLINDLLTYARVATKAQPFVLTNLATVTKEVVSDLEARIEQVNGKVEVGELPDLDADPLQVRQLMQNLIGNALKYKKPDVPPVVRISGVHPIKDPLAVEGEAARVLCQILVEDNGIGFEEIYAEKIFTIFQRLHGRTEYEGTGVGLAVCRKIVERHGGTITAKSSPGKGSTFTVTLPMRQPKENSADGCAA